MTCQIRVPLVCWWYWLTTLFAIGLLRPSDSFVVTPASSPYHPIASTPTFQGSTSLNLFLGAQESVQTEPSIDRSAPCYGFLGAQELLPPPSKQEASTIDIFAPCDGDESTIRKAAAFMVDAFWLNSPRHLIKKLDREKAKKSETVSESTRSPSDRRRAEDFSKEYGRKVGDRDPEEVEIVSGSTRAALVEEQKKDFAKTYGERARQRALDSALVTAVASDSNEIIGLVGVEVCLFDNSKEQIIPADRAELMLRDAVSSLDPKTRRRLKGSSIEELVSELLPSKFKAVCCLSNLAVSPDARGQGIAYKLCEEAEYLASVEWGCYEMVLKVESENTAARLLYEEKLGYQQKCTKVGATAVRVDAEKGKFVESQADTIILTKNFD